MKMDILIPSQFEKDWTDRVCPALEALGISGCATLESALGDLKQARIWPLSIRRPVAGSTIVARRNRGNFFYGDLKVHLDVPKWDSNEILVSVKSVYGMTIRAVSAELNDEEHVDWEGHTYLVISTDFVTLVADIMPGKDVFVVVGMWPSVMSPLYILTQQNLSFTSSLPLNSFRWIENSQTELLVGCSQCDETGKVDCKKCDGEGQWQPDGHCKKCGGSCRLTCDRCGGSGDYIGKYGDRMGDCRGCSGTGVIRCYVCKGTGEPPILNCNACSGTGQWDCRKCSGNGVIHVPFMSHLGGYGYYNETFSASDVSGWDAARNVEYPLDRGACAQLEKLVDDFGVHIGRQKKVEELQAEISKISHCLDRAMESEGITEEVLNFRSPPLGSPRSTTDRIKRRLVLAFPLLKLPGWAQTGDCPLAPDTEVQFLEQRFSPSEIEIPRTSTQLGKKPAMPVFLRMKSFENRPHFLISLPDDIELIKLPELLFIRPDIPPPSEVAQKKELARWCSSDRSPELLETIALDSGESQEPPRIHTDNSLINPSQKQALDWIMSEVPLVLVKGPPGTGKTTVITEAVLQSIKRKEKVLVCSETHQAVENVLDRLHRDGTIRMIRHGRADQRQLSSLGRDYLEDSSKQIFVRKVKDRVAEHIANRNSETIALEDLHSKALQAQQASIKLLEARQRLSVREQNARRKHSKVIEAAQEVDQATCDAAEQSANSELSRLGTEETRAKSDLERHEKKWEVLVKRRDDAKDNFRRKTGRDPDPEFQDSASIFRKFASLGANRLASPKQLNERFVSAVAALKEVQLEIKRLSGIIESRRNEKEGCCKQRDHKIAESKAQLDDQSKKAQTILEQQLETILGDSREAESQFLPPQYQATETGDSLGIFSVWEANVSPEIWDKRTSECWERLRRNKEELEFCIRWQDAAETASSALSALFWDTVQVFLSTCVGLASWRSFAHKFGSEGVDLVIIDEAAHATLTQSLIPMGRAKRAVLIGDEMQLPPAAPMGLRDKCEHSCNAWMCPVSLASEATGLKPEMSSCSIERSAFEWIAETRPWVPRVMLNRQFRMHPDIADFVSQVFYDDSLENGVSAEDRQLAFGSFSKAVCLVSTSAYKDRFEEKPLGATSFRNRLETQLTQRILEQASRHLESDTSFGVLTPYSAQKEMMIRELEGFFKGSGHMIFGPDDVASVDSFQGSERDVMIASFVRSPKKAPRKCRTCDGRGTDRGSECAKCHGTGWLGSKLNWVHDLRRLNVAFSRARKMLILVGDIEALTDSKMGTKQGTDVLDRFSQYISNRGRVLHVWEEESHE